MSTFTGVALKIQSPVFTSALLALCTAASFAQEKPPALVNLARLSIARVGGSVMNDGRGPNDPFYGPRHLFDGGTSIIKGINYSYWLSDSPNWAIVRFSRPVTVTGIIVDIEPGDSGVRAPQIFTVLLRGEKAPGILASPHIEINKTRSSYVPPRAMARVTEVVLLFDGEKESIRVDEVEVYGPPPPGVDLTPLTPPVDADLEASMSESRETVASRNLTLVHPVAQMELDAMRAIRKRIDTASTSKEKAKEWLRLNRAADRLAQIIGRVRESPTLQRAATFGVSFPYCEFDGGLYPGVEGYEKYLRLWPNGPEAAEVWWRAKLDGPGCSDFEGTAEEYVETIKLYSEFLKKFPKSRHAPEASRRMDEATKELKKIKQ